MTPPFGRRDGVTGGKPTGYFYHKIAIMTSDLSHVETAPPAADTAPPAVPLAAALPKSKLEIARHKAAQANALLQKLEAQARSRMHGENRKLDTRRKVLLGAYTLGKMQKDDEFRERTTVELNAYLFRDADRALFDLPPLPPKQVTPATPATPEI